MYTDITKCDAMGSASWIRARVLLVSPPRKLPRHFLRPGSPYSVLNDITAMHLLKT